MTIIRSADIAPMVDADRQTYRDFAEFERLVLEELAGRPAGLKPFPAPAEEVAHWRRLIGSGMIDGEVARMFDPATRCHRVVARHITHLGLQRLEVLKQQEAENRPARKAVKRVLLAWKVIASYLAGVLTGALSPILTDILKKWLHLE